MAISGVMRAGTVQIRVTDMAAAADHYENVLGLVRSGAGPDGRLYLKGWDEHDHHSVILRKAAAPGMDCMGFKVSSSEALHGFERRLNDLGLETERVAAGADLGAGERVRFVVPTGHTIELYAEMEQVGNGLSLENPEVSPDGLRGIHPTHFDHCLLYGDDVDGAVRVFTEALGFKLAERVVTPDGKVLIGAFLACSTKPHDVAFIRSEGKGKFHHAAFYVESWHDLKTAADLLTKRRVKLDIGPTRHGITRGGTIYFFDPAGNRNETFSGGYLYYPDRPTLSWTENELGRGIFYYDRRLNENFLGVTT